MKGLRARTTGGEDEVPELLLDALAPLAEHRRHVIAAELELLLEVRQVSNCRLVEISVLQDVPQEPAHKRSPTSFHFARFIANVSVRA